MVSEPNRILISAAAVAKLKSPGTWWDVEVKGFHVIRGKSAVTFFMQTDVIQPDGRRKSTRTKIGRLGATLDNGEVLTAQIARKLAKDVGADLRSRRIVTGRSVTLRAALNSYLAGMGNARTIETYRDVVERHLAAWLDLPLAKITKDMVRQRHAAIPGEIAAGLIARVEADIAKALANAKQDRRRERIEASAAARRDRIAARAARKVTGRAVANRAMKYFRAIWNAANEDGGLLACPTATLRSSRKLAKGGWYAEPARKQPIGDLSAWWAVVRKQTSIKRDALLFSLLSSMRKATVLTMRWEDVDLNRAMLTVPRPKGGEEAAYELPLSAPMLEILRRRKEENAALDSAKCAGWVFPSEDSDTGHLVEMRVKGGGWRVHDLRSTFTTEARRAGVDRHHVKKLLNHGWSEDLDVTSRHYDEITIDDLRGPQEVISAHIMRKLEAPPANVVSIGEARAAS